VGVTTISWSWVVSRASCACRFEKNMSATVNPLGTRCLMGVLLNTDIMVEEVAATGRCWSHRTDAEE
jgi:hypothetical protein